MRKVIVIAIMLITGLSGLCQAQQPSLTGKVISKTTNEPVMMATVVIKELNIWATTGEKGDYALKKIPDGTFTLVVSSLGYLQYEQRITFPYPGGKLDILVEEATLAIDDVIVTAQEGKRMASGSVIEQAAIQHVQPTDLSDVMQLLPGQLSQNPDLSKPKQLSIREINPGNDNMASIGTQILIDGAPVSNAANMQVLKTTGGSTSANFATTASGGTDVRQIPVDNIETIEVIRGIASVENGDILSGAVKVTMKKGLVPLTAKLKIDPGIKQVYAGKGFSLGDRWGTLNVDLDVTRSFDDIRERYKTFTRFNGGVTLSNTLFKDKKPLSLSMSVRGSQTIDINQNDPDMLDIEKYEANEKGISFNVNGKWALSSKLLTNLNFILSGNIQHQVGTEITSKSVPSGAQPQPIATEPGENVVPFLPTSYMSYLTIDGRPFYYNAKISGNRSLNIGKAVNNIVGGIEYNIYGNDGLGRIYDPSRPPSPTSGTDARPRSYKDIPALGQLALYLEENFSFPILSTRLDLQAGLRYTNVQPDGLFSSREETTMLDPRANVRYTLVDDNGGVISKFSVRGGYGFFSKAAPLVSYYPDKAYWDKPGMNYYDPVAYNGYFVVTTKIFDNPRNENLKPALNKKLEYGFDMKLLNTDISVTFFKEKLTDGFGWRNYYENFIFNKYTQPDQLGLADAFYYVPGTGVFYTDPVTGDAVQLPVTQDTVFVSFSYPSNDQIVDKKGVEFTIDLGTIKAIRTSFVIDGAYLYVKKRSSLITLTKPSVGSIGGKEFPYVAIYPSGDGDVDSRLNTNIRTITHIKELRMVVSLTAQIVWLDRSRNIYEDDYGTPWFYTTGGSEDPYSDVVNKKYINPIGYYDRQMVYHDFDPALATTRPYADMIKTYNTPWYFAETGVNPYYQINLKLTKEISDNIDFSFYANNFTNHDPLLKIWGGAPESYTRKNQSLYFGAELKIKFNQ